MSQPFQQIKIYYLMNLDSKISIVLMIPKSINFTSTFSPNLKIQESMTISTMCSKDMSIIFLSLFYLFLSSCTGTIHVVSKSESTSCQSSLKDLFSYRYCYYPNKILIVLLMAGILVTTLISL